MTLDFGMVFHMDAKSLLSWSTGTMVDKIRNLSLATSALWPVSKKIRYSFYLIISYLLREIKTEKTLFKSSKTLLMKQSQ